MAVGDKALEGADPDRLALAPATAVLLARVVADAPDARRQRAQVHDLLERGEKTPLANVGDVGHAGQVRGARLLARRTRFDLPACGIERGDHPDQRQRADGHPAPGVWFDLQRRVVGDEDRDDREVEQPARGVRGPGVTEPGKQQGEDRPDATARAILRGADESLPQIKLPDTAPTAPGAALVDDRAVVAFRVSRRVHRLCNAADRRGHGARRPGLPRLRIHGFE